MGVGVYCWAVMIVRYTTLEVTTFVAVINSKKGELASAYIGKWMADTTDVVVVCTLYCCSLYQIRRDAKRQPVLERRVTYHTKKYSTSISH